ncbi:MAG: ABC transporter permease [Beduini sp.]|uniref:ABC transporter permease n=1 Tax=Beduini sp. TaxID=1922300 RepID=UPI0011CBFA69
MEETNLTEKELFTLVEYSPEDAEKTGYSDYSYWKSVFSTFLKNKVAVTLLVLFVAVVIFSFVALSIAKFSYNMAPNTPDMLLTPNSTYWFGTDSIGRDMWSRVWYSSQVSLKLAGIVALGECLIGVIIGCLWGYIRKLDRFFTELYNIIANVPQIIYLTLIAFIVGQGFWSLAMALIFTGWLAMARNVRNLVLMYRDREYNLASRCLGTPLRRILTKNLVPYLVSVVILRLALSIPNTISLESTLSYLGLGLPLDIPSLGILLRDARTVFLNFPHLLIFPALIVSLITITFYLIGNAFSDASDPRNHV